MKSSLVATLAVAAVLLFSGAAHAGKTVDEIRARGQLACGVSTGVAGFSAADSKGEWRGMDVDFCRALAAAVLKDPAKVRWSPLTSQQRFTALQSGEIDVLSRNTTWTLGRDAGQGLVYAGYMFIDGQGFLVHKRSGVTAAKQLNGAEICVQTGTTTEKNLAEFARANGIQFKTLMFENLRAVLKAFFSGRCQAFTADASALASIRANDSGKPEDYLVLPDRISKEPLGPVVRRGDEDWFALVRWAIFALLEAEEQGITQANVDQMRKSADPAVQRLLGVSEDVGKPLGLDREWVYRMLKAVGNYSEIFERNVGPTSLLQLPRGINALPRDGGVMYSPPLR
ncbi:MAG TPA: amino acid ABC transporter substrate-binding protein [Rhodocyclaceae bacterium]|nr:amino acid ABC transporter substrate-binding protein [Rhodocyclaceae bacterium]